MKPLRRLSDACGVTRIAYCSCRNRYCPKCQGSAAYEWLADREGGLLPVPYFLGPLLAIRLLAVDCDRRTRLKQSSDFPWSATPSVANPIR